VTTLSTIRTGLATNLATITGLSTAAVMPDAITPPVAIVVPEGITFDSAMARGLDEYSFTIMVIVGRADARTSQSLMDTYCNPTGASSVKTALQIDRTLSGAAQSLRVTEMRSYSSLTAGDVTYLAAEFAVTVYA
jgi:hypothetical protein